MNYELGNGISVITEFCDLQTDARRSVCCRPVAAADSFFSWRNERCCAFDTRDRMFLGLGK